MVNRYWLQLCVLLPVNLYWNIKPTISINSKGKFNTSFFERSYKWLSVSLMESNCNFFNHILNFKSHVLLESSSLTKAVHLYLHLIVSSGIAILFPTTNLILIWSAKSFPSSVSYLVLLLYAIGICSKILSCILESIVRFELVTFFLHNGHFF
jgi:hypothetical protein